ncbi:MAG: phosphate ABC transporter substrate-binding protein PstS [Nitrospiraceae bacterium]|nr:phosphate ABC transporter substrate-binding protein PstS [Nitrospiraceae bacterium]
MKTSLKMVLAAVLSIIVLASGLAFAAAAMNGAGSTFAYPIYSAWAYAYNRSTGVQLNYQSIGSGGGQQQIINRTVDFGASDEPLKPEKLKRDRLLQFPAVMGGVVIVVNMPGMRPGALKLDPNTLCAIFLGNIKFWDDTRITSLNRGMNLPHRPITVVHRSEGSGTTAIFTTYLSEVCRDWKTRVGSGNAVNWPVGIGGKGSEGVSNYVKRTSYSIGYVEFAYALQNRMTYTLLKNAAGNFVAPTFATFKEAAATANFDPRKDFYLWMVNAPGRNAWPIAGATFILLSKEQPAANKKVARFFDWAFKNGDRTAENLAYVPLPASLKEKIRGYWKKEGVY